MARCLPLLLALCCYCAAAAGHAQKGIDCRSVHDGVFSMGGEDKARKSIITRKGDRQTEDAAFMGLRVRYKVTWTSECCYTLSGRRVVKGKEPWPSNPGDSLFVRIVSISDEQVHLEVRSNFSDLKTDGVMERITPEHR